MVTEFRDETLFRFQLDKFKKPGIWHTMSLLTKTGYKNLIVNEDSFMVCTLWKRIV